MVDEVNTQDDSNNPVGRLLQVVQKAKTEGPRQNHRSIFVWAEVFDIAVTNVNTYPPPNVQEQVVERLLQTSRLITEAEDALRAAQLSEKFFRPFERLRNLIHVSLQGMGGELAAPLNAITDGDLTVLEFGAEELSTRSPEQTVDQHELEAILNAINELIEDIKANDGIPNELRVFVLEQLENLRRAIYEYGIRGITRLREALAQTTSNLILNWTIVEKEKKSPVFNRFKHILVRFSRAAAEVTITSIVEGLVKGLLGPATPPAPPEGGRK